MKDEDKHSEEMDKLFQGAFAQWEPAPEPAAWNKVEARLNGKRRKRIAILLTGVLLIGMVGAWYFWPEGKLSTIDTITISSNNSSAKQLNSNSTTTSTVNSSTASSGKENNKQPIAANTDTQAQPVTSNGNLPTEHQANTAPGAKADKVTDASTNGQVNSNLVISTKKKNNKIAASSTKSAAMSSDNSAATVSHHKNKAVSERSIVAKQDATDKSENTISGQERNRPVTNNEAGKNKQQSETTVTNNTSGVSNTSITDEKSADEKNTSSTTAILLSAKDSTKSTVTMADTKAASTSTDLMQNNKSEEKNNNIQTTKKDSTQPNTYAVAKKDSTVKQNSKLHKLSVSIFESPEIGENKVTSTNAQFNIQDAKSTIRFSAGAKLNIKLNDHFEVNIGLSYSQYKQSNNSDSAYLVKSDSVPYVFTTSLGNMSIPDSSMNPKGIIFFQPRSIFGVSYKYTETVSFINMPINAKYTFGNGKLRPYVTAGLSLQYLLNESASLEVIRVYSSSQTIDKHFTYNNLDITRFNFGPSAGAGLEYILTDRLDIYLEPNARLNMLNFSGSAKSTNYFIGCQAGVRIGL